MSTMEMSESAGMYEACLCGSLASHCGTQIAHTLLQCYIQALTALSLLLTVLICADSGYETFEDVPVVLGMTVCRLIGWKVGLNRKGSVSRLDHRENWRKKEKNPLKDEKYSQLPEKKHVFCFLFFTQCHFNSLYVVTLLLSTDGRSNNKRLLIACVSDTVPWFLCI